MWADFLHKNFGAFPGQEMKQIMSNMKGRIISTKQDQVSGQEFHC